MWTVSSACKCFRTGRIGGKETDLQFFPSLDGTLCRHSPLNFRYVLVAGERIAGDLTLCSMDKSRKLGWHGFVDSTESFLEVFRDLAKIKMIPPVPEVRVKFN